ncbi:ATP-dependent metallopeptidase FtsH/Yme1/Tma family protein [Peribacillus frigoritolerans]|uniref:ATP-dependent metallopeptidase FtsH/Yme1/Tma family protein n=1 Tax=Peribacillus frigoritolerans TaxID=450367 RepID=UPI0007BFAA9C|nr:ATP-dependent metallopeptidase FtsH/Yme1/Tma family protein [Peribacillus frigoritolerans]
MKQIFRSKIFYLISFLTILGVLLVFNNDEEPTEKLTDDEFFTNLADGKVTLIEVEQRKSVIEISGRLAGYKKDQYFVASVPNSETSLDRMNNAAEEHDIKNGVYTIQRGKRMGHPVYNDHYVHDHFLPVFSLITI